MTRGLTLATATEAARRNGAFPVHVLEIEWHDGIRLYSDGAALLPVPAEPRVKDWGSLVIESTPEQLGGYSDLSITMFDTDRALMSLATSAPGFPGAKAKLYLWFVGTDWNDKLTLFGGHVMQPSTYDFKDGTWKLKLAGYEKQYQKHLGLTITRQRFADVICESCDGKLIPIVFGDPCLRVPCCVIDRPGRSWLAAPLGLHDPYLYIQGNPVNPDPTQTDPLYNPYGFTNDTTITIDVGPAGNTEKITGCFCTPSDRTKFTIYSRSSIQASGTSPGVLGIDGHYHFLINASDISDPSFGRGGYIIYIFHGGQWNGYIIGEWITSGSSIAVLDVTNLYPLGGGAIPWKISSMPSESIPYWPVGSDVYEEGDWTYVANFLPSQWVDRIEAMAKLNPPGGGNPVETWYTYSSSYYFVNRDNRAYNNALGRDMGSPGITTLTLTASPAVLGFDDETVYATIRGVTTGLFGGDTCANPAKIIKTLLTHPQLGNVPPDEIDDYSFACAESATLSQRMAFAITTPQKLFEICAQLAFQAGLLHFWDCGKAYLSPVDTVPDASKSVLTIDATSTQRGSLQISDPGETDKATELAGTYRLTCAADQSTLVRQSLQQVDMFGRQRREVDFWGFQNNRFVALQTEFWLATLLSQQRQVTVTTYLNALHVQPGDVVKLNQIDGDGNALLSNVPARVQRVSHKFLTTSKGTMETIELQAVANLWSVEAEVAAVDLDACNPPAGDVQIVKNDMDHIKPPPGGPTTTTSSTTSTTTTLPCLCVGTAESITVNLPSDITKTSLYGGGVAIPAGNYTFIKNVVVPSTSAPYRCWYLWSNGPIGPGSDPWTTGTQWAHASFEPGSLGNQRPEVTWQTSGGSVYYGGFGTYAEGDCGSLPKQSADSGIASAPSYVTLSGF